MRNLTVLEREQCDSLETSHLKMILTEQFKRYVNSETIIVLPSKLQTADCLLSKETACGHTGNSIGSYQAFD